MKRSKQKNHWRLLCQQLRYAQVELATSFVLIVDALPARPEPRSIWDNVASPGRVAVKGFQAVVAARIAINAALDTGSIAIIEETARRIEAFFDALKYVALAPYYAFTSGRPTSVREKEIRASKEGGEALHSLLAEDCLRARVRELRESIAAQQTLLNDYVAQLDTADARRAYRVAA